MSNPLNIFVLDDDREELELIQRAFDKAGIINYIMYDDEKLFLENLGIGIHIAVIDHFVGTEKTGKNILEMIFQSNIDKESIIQTKVIVVSGQADANLFMYYTSRGAIYMNKNEPDFYNILVFLIKRELEDIAFKIDLYERQLKRMVEVKQLFS